MAAASVLPKLVGQRVKRREDPRLIQGRGTYVDDVKIPGMQHLAFKRSDIAHGRIRSIDTRVAGAMDGVEATFTGAQVAGFLAPMPIGTPYPSPEHRAVAVDTVRFVGDPVAVVVACDRYVARTEPARAACHPKDRSGAEEVRSTSTRREQRLLPCLTYPHDFPKTHFAHSDRKDLQSMVIEVKGGASVNIADVRVLGDVLSRDSALLAGLVVRTFRPARRRTSHGRWQRRAISTCSA